MNDLFIAAFNLFIFRKIIFENFLEFFCQDSCSHTRLIFLYLILQTRIVNTIHRQKLIGSKYMRQNRYTGRKNFNITNNRVSHLKIGIRLKFISDNIESFITRYCRTNNLICIHGTIIPIHSHRSISILRILILHDCLGDIDKDFLQSRNHSNTKFEISNFTRVIALRDIIIILTSKFFLIVVNSSNGSKVHTLNISIFISRTTRQNCIINRILQTTSFSFRSTTDNDSAHITRETNITKICIKHFFVHHGNNFISFLSRIFVCFLHFSVANLISLSICIEIRENDIILRCCKLRHIAEIRIDEIINSFFNSINLGIDFFHCCKFIFELSSSLIFTRFCLKNCFQIIRSENSRSSNNRSICKDILKILRSHSTLYHHNGREVVILNCCTSLSLNCTSKSIIKMRSKNRNSRSRSSNLSLKTMLNSEKSSHHMIMINIGHIVIAEESKNSISSTILIIVCIDKSFQSFRSAIKLIAIYNRKGTSLLQSHIYINGRIVSLLINFLNHPRDLFIFIGRSICNTINIFKISFFIDLMKILIRTKIFNDFIFYIIEHIQNISLTERFKITIFLHLVNKFISSYDDSSGTITDFFHHIIACIFDEAIKSIIQRLTKTKTVHNIPAIFSDIMRRAIINNSSSSKRTKCILQYICSGMRYSSKCFLIFIAIYNIHTGTNVFINCKTIHSNIHHIRKIHISKSS